MKSEELNEAIVLLGSNVGERFKMLADAINYLHQSNVKIITQSGIYETAPWGIENQPAFLNQVLKIETQIAAYELLKLLLSIENKMGRVREKKWEQRCIDLDILFFNEEVINSEGLTIPHPHLHERRFTLIPLAELIPDFIHPVFNKSVKQLLLECMDDKEVLPIEPH